VFSPDGLHVATAGMDGYVKFYELGREDDIDPRFVAALFCIVCAFLLKSVATIYLKTLGVINALFNAHAYFNLTQS
jgi:hypothetical protein